MGRVKLLDSIFTRLFLSSAESSKPLLGVSRRIPAELAGESSDAVLLFPLVFIFSFIFMLPSSEPAIASISTSLPLYPTI